MNSELSQRPVWRRMGRCLVTSELFLDVVYTSFCDCACPFCIARTEEYAEENKSAWMRAARDAFSLFDIKNVILLGGEATLDPAFWEKTDFLARAMAGKHVDHMILTTNGIKLRDSEFAARLLSSRIDAVNLSRMHYEQAANDAVFGQSTLTREEIVSLYRRLRSAGKTLRLNVNVWRGSLDSAEEMDAFVHAFSGCCDAVKFTPLMRTDMFGTVPEVTRFTRQSAIPEGEIAALWNGFLARHRLLGKRSRVLGFVDYAEAEAFGQRVILKYAQVEDKYDRDTVIPTLKLYPNGCLSNEWSFTRDIRDRLR